MKASKKQWWRVCLTSVVVAFALACSCMIAGCDYTVRIPMRPGVDSLNVAAASAVTFWELCK